MFVENINNGRSGYAISFSDISKGCIWSLEISENIEYSSNRESSSKGKGIIFIECLLAVGTLVSPSMIDNIAVSDAQVLNRKLYPSDDCKLYYPI